MPQHHVGLRTVEVCSQKKQLWWLIIWFSFLVAMFAENKKSQPGPLFPAVLIKIIDQGAGEDIDLAILPQDQTPYINGGTVASCDSCGWFFSWKIPLKWMNHYKYILDMVMKMVSKIFQNGLKWMILGYHHFRKPPYVGDFLDDPRQLPLNPCWYPGSQHASVFHSQPLIYGYYMVNILLIMVEYGYYMVNNG